MQHGNLNARLTADQWSAKVAMPKLKTHKGLSKRVKVTKKGKIKRMQAFHRHLMTGKGGARRRRGKRSVIMHGAEAKRMARLLGLR